MSLLDRVLHKHKARSSAELVSRAASVLDALDVWHGPSPDKQLDEAGRLLGAIKIALFGDGDAVPSKEAALALAAEACAADLPAKLIAGIEGLDFETRKDAAQVLGAIFRMNVDGETPGADYLEARHELLAQLLDGYNVPTIALNCGAVLRDAARDPRTAARLLADDAALAALLAAVDAPSFETASDAFATLRDLLTRHKDVVAAHLEAGDGALFGALAPLLASPNYVTRRQSVRLLGELLLERANAGAMLRYVGDPDNLKAAMVLLKDPSRSIQFEAFHVFKIFVANPHKTPAVAAILASNRGKLLKHLTDFQADRDGDEQFAEEKAVVLREIAALGEEGGGGGAPA